MRRIERRKSDHIDVTLKENVIPDYDYWADVHLVHQSLPEVDMDDIDTSVMLFGKRLDFPLVVTAITGGFELAETINRNLAEACERMGVGLGVGSQRPAMEGGDDSSYSILRDYDIPLRIGNVGVPQLVPQKGGAAFTIDDIIMAGEMVNADVMAIHLNFLQEVVQPEGDTNAKGCLEAIRNVSRQVPTLIKETGAGISRESALRLKGLGIVGLDVSGVGGTSFAAVEMHRARNQGDKTSEALGRTYFEWGIPAPIAVLEANVGMDLIASGGVDDGLRMAKGIALGASSAGTARALLADAMESSERVVETLERMKREFKVAMFLTGCQKVKELQNRRIVVTGRTAQWLTALEE